MKESVGAVSAVTSEAAASLSALPQGIIFNVLQPYRRNINNEELSIPRTTLSWW